MNEKERILIKYICDGDIKKSQQQAKIILNGISSKQDETFKSNMIRKLETKSNMIELPYNLRELLIAEDVSNFPEKRFVLRAEEEKTVKLVISAFKASKRLSELGISYVPALMLYGKSGGGKTMLARYIAYKTDLPFVYVRFSSIVSSYLGSTQSNIAKVFDYARTTPCVLCFDEIDSVGMARGQKNDIGEMNRIVIALMQEMDRLPNNVVVVGTTNRYDRLDQALVRRFPIKHEVIPMELSDINILAKKFFENVGINTFDWIDNWCKTNFERAEPASTVIEKCTSVIVDKIIKESNNDFKKVGKTNE